MVPSEFKHDALMDLIRSNRLKRRILKRSVIERICGLKFFVYKKIKGAILDKTKNHYPAPLLCVGCG